MSKTKSKAVTVVAAVLALLVLASGIFIGNFPVKAASTLNESNVKLNYYPYNPPFNNLETELQENLMTLTLVGLRNISPDNYTVTVEKDSSPVSDLELKVIGNSQNTLAWALSKEKATAGTYTVKISEKAALENTADISIVLHEVKFHAGDGTFTEPADVAGNTVTVVAAKGTSFKYTFKTTPKLTPTDTSGGKEFIGWATQEHATDYSTLRYSVPTDEDGPYTFYAAYGVKRTYGCEVQKDDSKLVDDTQNFESVEYGYNPTPVTLKLKNTGNTNLTGVGVGNSLVHFKVELGSLGADNSIGQGQSADLTITPVAGLAVGEYSEVLLVGPRSVGFLRITVKITVEPKKVKITPATITKSYGETKSAGDVTVTVDPATVDYNQLGVTLGSDGFAATANANPDGYAYEIESATDTNYNVTLADDAGKVIVTQAKPTGVVTASPVTNGQNLSDSALSGTFKNPHKLEWIVPGTLTWNDSDTALTASGQHNWKFTPSDDVKNNYEEVTGTTYVVVNEYKNSTQVTPVDGDGTSFTFVYDGQQHPLEFKTDRPPEVGGDITVEYQLNGAGDRVTDAPVNAGTYTVYAYVEANPDKSYGPGLFEGQLIIEQREVQVALTVKDKSYDGTTEAAITARVTNTVNNDDVKVTATGTFAAANAGNGINVTVTSLTLDGAAKDNYKLPALPLHTAGNITPAQVTLAQKGNAFTKEYGELKVLTADDLEVNGLQNGEPASLLALQFECAGFDPSADVREDAGKYYDITVTSDNPNYTLSYDKEKFRLKVTKATPVIGGVSAGYGYKTGTLKDVTLSGEFINPHNNAPVAGTFTWQDPNHKLGNTDSENCTWVFALAESMKANYKEPVPNTGEVTITLLENIPIAITVTLVETTYSGKPVEYNAFRIDNNETGVIPDGITVKVEYQLVTGGKPEPDAYGENAPTDAGSYSVKITATPEQEGQGTASNSVEVALTILPAAPGLPVYDANLQAVEGTPAEEIPMLEGFKYPTDLNGEPLEGTFAWDAAGSTVNADGSVFNYTFTPANPNYSNVKGSVTVDLAPDTREISAVVYNLPNADGYDDYAVVNISESGLAAGETVVFYTTAECVNPESEPYTVTADDITKGTVKIMLDGDALSSETGGEIFAKIASSQKDVANSVSYPVELGFTVPKTYKIFDIVPEHDIITAEVPEIYGDMVDGDAVFTLEGEEYVTKGEVQGLSATFEFKAEGTTKLNVTVNFKHPDSEREPDGIISVTKTVTLISEKHTHKGALVPEKKPTCTEDGNIAYYVCECDTWFSDEACEKEIEDHASVILKATGHKLTHVEAKEATADTDGNIEYWYCENCGKYYKDENATQEISQSDTVIPATGETGTAPGVGGNTESGAQSPQTGDNRALGMWLTVLGASALALIGCVTLGRRRKSRK